MSTFIPEGYVAPSNEGGYTKLETGENNLRILSNPLFMWSEWRDGKAIRHPFVNAQTKPAKGDGQKDSVKHSWGLIVWNYKTKKIEIFELDKAGIMDSLKALSEKPAWGHPKNFDICIKKTGSGMETEYLLTPEPPTEVSNEIVEAFTETPIDLNQLLIPNGNPFLPKSVAANPANPNTQPAQSSEKIVTPENWVAGDKIPVGYEISQDGTSIAKKKLPF